MRRWPVMLGVLALVGAGAAAVMLPGGLGAFQPTMRGSGDSMSHGAPQPGILDDGDLGNYVANPAFADITTMVRARQLGAPQVAGDWGDVLVFRPDGVAREQDGHRIVVEHRALVWVQYDPATGTFDVPELGLAGVRQLTIPEVGSWDPASDAYVRKDLTLTLVATVDGQAAYPFGQHSGWITKGDHNLAVDQDPGADGQALTALVKPEWVEAKLARVVDQEQVVFDAALGAGAALVIGGAAILGWHWARKDPAGAPSLRLPRLRAKCDACGTPWAELPFCGKCGAERVANRRYATLEQMEQERLASVAKRGR